MFNPVEPNHVVIYQTSDGREPFTEWLDTLKDRKALIVISKRIDRLASGNLGDCKSLKDGVYEARIHYGAGYRIYFAQEEDYIVVLLIGGDKATQQRNITQAKEYLKDYLDDKKNSLL